MYRRLDKIAESLMLATLVVMNLCTASWADPPPPPVIPATPVGSTEIIIATAVAIAGYGYWKSRK